jgi:excisionase family DNA binding protein
MPRPTDTSSPDLMTTAEVAAFLRTPVKTVRDWTYRRVGPPSMKVGTRRLYSRHDVVSWLNERRTA